MSGAGTPSMVTVTPPRAVSTKPSESASDNVAAVLGPMLGPNRVTISPGLIPPPTYDAALTAAWMAGDAETVKGSWFESTGGAGLEPTMFSVLAAASRF